MKLIFLFNLFLLLCLTVSAQVNPQNPDSVAYQNQRKKINGMLAARALKFGQYDASLSKHTGIFGLQTKKDIRHSNDILMDIARTDNNIFIQTKVLLAFKNNQLNYRTYQQQTVQNQVKETQDVSLGFMTTINKLRTQNEKLAKQYTVAASHFKTEQRWYRVIIVLMAASILFLLTRKPRYKA